MARIRYIKPEFFSDEDLAELKFETRLTFAGLWCFADRLGRLEDRPKFLKAMIFPYDNVDMEKQLQALSAKPFIQRYEVEGKKFIQIINWEKHQKPHHTEADSKIPPAPPLKEKGDFKGNGECQAESSELDNGELTVKEPLVSGRTAPSNGDFLSKIKSNPAYSHINLENEFSKMDAWLSLPKNKGRKKTPRFILNWLNKIEKPLEPSPVPTTLPAYKTESAPDWIKEAVKQGWKA